MRLGRQDEINPRPLADCTKWHPGRTASRLYTLAGLLPLAISRGEGSETWQPLGITMIGGLSVSTFITMLFVPTLYAVFETHLKKREEKRKRRACPVTSADGRQAAVEGDDRSR